MLQQRGIAGGKQGSSARSRWVLGPGGAWRRGWSSCSRGLFAAWSSKAHLPTCNMQICVCIWQHARQQSGHSLQAGTRLCMCGSRNAATVVGAVVIGGSRAQYVVHFSCLAVVGWRKPCIYTAHHGQVLVAGRASAATVKKVNIHVESHQWQLALGDGQRVHAQCSDQQAIAAAGGTLGFTSGQAVGPVSCSLQADGQ